MAGERLASTDVVREFGVPGDRGWAVRDETTGDIASGRKLTALVQFSARYVEEPVEGSTPAVAVTFPDGSTRRSDRSGMDEALSHAIGRPVTLWPRVPAGDLEHYRRTERFDEQEQRRQLALLPDDPMPDYAASPPEVHDILVDYVSPPGTYFDAVELSLVTSTSLASLGALAPDSVLDTRRFRQNLVVDTGAALSGFPEAGWVGSRVRIGDLVARVVMPISRCAMVTLPQADLPRDRSLMRTLVKATGMDLGVYLKVVEPGRVNEGDPIELLA